MNTRVKQESRLPSLQMDEGELLEVLRSSLYPGASDQSIKMVLGYCKASGLDPMRKPVHIVPMWDSKASSMRDVVMPGIGLYRTDAARTGEYGGITEPEFGPDKTETIGGAEITYPQWCRVTVSRRMPSGEIVKFTASEFWKENYAVKGGKEKSIAPNAMWQKRPYGQIAKCAEAQALRKAFPEVGSQPTADEMEGKTLDMGAAEVVGAPTLPPPPKPYDTKKFDENFPKWKEVVAIGHKSANSIISFIESKGNPLTEEQKAKLLSVKVGPTPNVTDVKPKEAEQPKRPMDVAEIETLIQAAETQEDLQALYERIGAISDAPTRARLVDLAAQRADKLPPF